MLRTEKEANLAAANAAVSNHPVLPRFLRIQTAVNYSGISRSTLYELLNTAAIRSHRVGGMRLIDRLSIDEFISAQPAA